jgi:hypothetical protein
MHLRFIDDSEMENVLLDSTIIWAHPCAAGAPEKRVDNKLRHSDAAEAGLAPKSM